MNNRLTLILIGVLVAATLLASALLYPRMPERMPIHWNAAGEVDGYGSRFTGLFLTPLVMVGMVLLMLAIPAIDPLKKNITLFRPTFNLLMLILTAYFAYLHALTLASALGYRFNMTTMLLPALALLFYVIGDLLKRARRNYMVGIRTPWTLASDQTWEATHRVGSLAFKICAGLSLIGLFLGEAGIWLFVIAMLGAVLFTLVYSYVYYQRATDKPS